MPRYHFDLSDYQQPEPLEHSSEWNGCDDLALSFFENSVSCSSEDRILHIDVAPTYEFGAMHMLYDALNYPVPEVYDREASEEEMERWRADTEKARGRFGAVFEVEQTIPFELSVAENRINAFSGTEVRVPLGEGLLNFCYADFRSAFERCTPAYRKLTQEEDPPVKIRNAEEGMIQFFELYAKVFPALREVFYDSLYTAAFPPQFIRPTQSALDYYRRYLLSLQTEFLEILEFCMDKEYRPEILGQLYPSERYSLWCKIKGVADTHTRQETFEAGSHRSHGTQMPFGVDMEELNRNFQWDFALTPEQKAFAKEHGLLEVELQIRYQFPRFISTVYACNNLRDMLYLEFTKILEAGVEFQKCKRCGRYFLVKGNYHGTYCDRVADGESRTCQQLAAQEAYLNKLRDNGGENPLNVYRKYYKRYFARMTAGSLRPEKFKRWQYEAVQKRDECIQGTTTLQEFTDWLEGSMPNRTKKA